VSPLEALLAARQHGVRIRVVGNELKVSAPGPVPVEILHRLKEHHDVLKRMLTLVPDVCDRVLALRADPDALLTPEMRATMADWPECPGCGIRQLAPWERKRGICSPCQHEQAGDA
jgi:hypothetical protein